MGMECVPMVNAGHVVGQKAIIGCWEVLIIALMIFFVAAQVPLGCPIRIHVEKDLWEKSQVPSPFHVHHPIYQKEQNLKKSLLYATRGHPAQVRNR